MQTTWFVECAACGVFYVCRPSGERFRACSTRDEAVIRARIETERDQIIVEQGY